MSNYPCGFNHAAYEAQFNMAEILINSPNWAASKFTGRPEITASMEQFQEEDGDEKNGDEMDYFYVTIRDVFCPILSIEMCEVGGEPVDFSIIGKEAITLLENAIKKFRERNPS
jgi:hypothetical protein